MLNNFIAVANLVNLSFLSNLVDIKAKSGGILAISSRRTLPEATYSSVLET